MFLARIATDGWTRAPSAIAIDEKTAVLIDAAGDARVVGSGAAYFLRTQGPPDHCKVGTPLTYLGIAVSRWTAGSGEFNVKSWTGSGGLEYKLSGEEGVLKSTLPGNQIY